jgi:hypothetical protein
MRAPSGPSGWSLTIGLRRIVSLLAGARELRPLTLGVSRSRTVFKDCFRVANLVSV